MNSRVFGVTGWALMVLGIVIPIWAILMQISQYLQRGLGFSDIFFEGLLFGAIFFALVFLPGIKYYQVSKKGRNNSLEGWAVWLTIATIILGIIIFILLVTAGDPEGVAWGMAGFGVLLLIPYCIGILLLIINLFMKEK